MRFLGYACFDLLELSGTSIVQQLIGMQFFCRSEQHFISLFQLRLSYVYVCCTLNTYEKVLLKEYT